MTAGLQVFTSNGALQIDENYKNLHLLRKYTLSNLTAYATGLYRHQVQSDEICYAFGSSNKNKKVFVIYWDGRSNYIPANEVYFGNVRKAFYADMTGYADDNEVTIYAFGFADIRVSAHDAGLVVYDANSKPTYYSGDKSMRVLYYGNQAYSYPSNRDVAITSFWGAELFTKNQYGYSTAWAEYCYMAFGLNQPQNYTEVMYSASPTPSGTEIDRYYETMCDYMLLDVTNF